MRDPESIEKGMLSRYDMSYYTFRQLQRDHIRFEQKYVNEFPNGFICRILENYMCYAQENHLDEFEKEVSNLFKKKQNNEYYHDNRISFTSSLTDKMREFDFVSDDNFKKRPVITYILDRFTALSLSEREKIYYHIQYKTIIDAINKNEILLINNSGKTEYEVKPYDIAIDDNSLSYYLTGYSRAKGSSDAFGYYSFKLSRIKECRSKHREFKLTNKEQKAAKEILEKFGAAYVAKNLTSDQIEKTVVRLTKDGYESLYLKVIAHQRPTPLSAPKRILINGIPYYDLEFDCSHWQIRNYFFSFGMEAEVISPQSLRELFIQKYQKAIKRYLDEP